MHQGSCGFHDYIKAERLDKRDFAWKGVPACSFGEPMRTRDQPKLEFHSPLSYNLRKLAKRSTMHVTEGLLL